MATTRTLRILIAPSGFKEGLPVEQAVTSMAYGVRRACPDAEILTAPVPDGGEGFTRTLVSLTGGTLHVADVSGPLGDPVRTEIGLLGGAHRGVAVIDIASAAGLKLVPRDRRDPLRTTSYGVGELIRAALDLAPKRLIVGCGDSGVNDGGAGMAQALGVALCDRNGRSICRGGGALINLSSIGLAGRDSRIAEVSIEAAVNAQNMLLGMGGVSRVYGPQKGASPEAITKLERGLQVFAAIVKRDSGMDVASLPGAGASGGIGAGLAALLGATLTPRMELALRFVPLAEHMARADLVLTAEGRLDAQSARGKVPGEIGRLSLEHGVPVFAIGGSVMPDIADLHDAGIDACFCLQCGPATLDEAIRDTARNLAAATEQVVRAFLAGRRSSVTAESGYRFRR